MDTDLILKHLALADEHVALGLVKLFDEATDHVPAARLLKRGMAED
jgi:hypothetical protein